MSSRPPRFGLLSVLALACALLLPMPAVSAAPSPAPERDGAGSLRVPLFEASQVAAGGEHSCGVRTDGTLWCWGRNKWGQLGVAPAERARWSPTQVGRQSGWAAVAAGGASTCAIRTTGRLWCWGLNHRGQLGNGTRTSAVTPVAVGEARWRQVSVGWFTSCGVTTDGALWCWGDGSAGQLGNGSRRDATRPVRVPGSGWASVAVAGWHVCGVRTDGSLWCWGRNTFGEVGDGTTAVRSRPVRVGSGSDWTQVAVSWTHTCARTAGGDVRCWGRNHSGQLGDGTVADRRRPGPAVAGVLASDLAVTEGATCASGADLRLWCWGTNAYDVLADEALLAAANPVRAPGQHQGLSGGWLHLCSRSAGGMAGCWGSNEHGQRGDGTTSLVPTPPGRQGAAPPPARRAAPTTFTLATANVLGNGHTRPYADSDGFAPSRVRAEWLARALLVQGPVDVVGLQETTEDQLRAIMRSTDGRYSAVPDPSRRGSVQTSLLYRNAVWRVTRTRVVRSQFIRRALPRPLVQLQHKVTGRRIWVMSVHNAPWGYQAQRNRATRVQLAEVARLEATGVPVFYVGDMNEKATILCKVLRRTDLVSPLGGRLVGGSCRPPRQRMRVDWIFGSDQARYSGYVASRHPLVRIATDHTMPIVSVHLP